MCTLSEYSLHIAFELAHPIEACSLWFKFNLTNESDQTYFTATIRVSEQPNPSEEAKYVKVDRVSFDVIDSLVSILLFTG